LKLFHNSQLETVDWVQYICVSGYCVTYVCYVPFYASTLARLFKKQCFARSDKFM